MGPLPFKVVTMHKEFYLANWADLHVLFVRQALLSQRFLYCGVGLKDCLSQNASILRIIWNKFGRVIISNEGND